MTPCGAPDDRRFDDENTKHMDNDAAVNVLIVDDRSENLFAMEAILAELDINIVTAASGQEALANMLELDFAVVLLDVQMPDMDGFEVAELMKKNEKTKRIPIIFVTAISKEEKHIFTGYEVGCVDYLFKPLDPFIVKSKVSIFLELYRQRKSLQSVSRELKRSLDELRFTNDALAEANRTIIEQQKSVIAEERLKAILQVTNAAAHEMNQPLTVLLGSIQLMKSNEGDQDKTGYYMAKIENAGKDLSEIVNKLLDIQWDVTKETGGGSMIDLKGD